MSDKCSGTAHLHLLHVFSLGTLAARIYSCSHCIFSCYCSSVERSQPGDRPQDAAPQGQAMLLVLVSLMSQDLVFGLCWGWQGLGDPRVALVPGDALMSRRDLPSTCAWRHPSVFPSQEHPRGFLPPASVASGDICPRPRQLPFLPSFSPPSPLALRLLGGARIRGRLGRGGGAECGGRHQPGCSWLSWWPRAEGLGLPFSAPQSLSPDGLLLSRQRGSSKWSLRPVLRAASPASPSPFVPSPCSLPPILFLSSLQVPQLLQCSRGALISFRKAPSSHRTDCSASAETY